MYSWIISLSPGPRASGRDRTNPSYATPFLSDSSPPAASPGAGLFAFESATRPQSPCADGCGPNPDKGEEEEPRDQAKPIRTVPTRPDGWPDWLGRRPMTNTDRVKIRQNLDNGLPDSALTAPGPFLCYLTIDGLDHEPDPQKATRLRGQIHAAARAAAEHRQTNYHATNATITIGIRGPDAQQRINQLRNALTKLITQNPWTTREQPR
jgi:hypothetical protein